MAGGIQVLPLHPAPGGPERTHDLKVPAFHGPSQDLQFLARQSVTA